MAPKRAARAAATPSPAPRPSPGPNATPGRLIRGGIADSGKAAAARTAMPTKYSTSYGSPMSQLPNKAVIHGGASLAEATSDVFKTVKEDQRAAAGARRKAEERRQTVSGRTPTPPAPASTKPSITAATEEESEDEIQRSVEVSPEWEELGESVEPEPVKRPPGRPKKTETANKLGKRQRDEAEAAERQAEQERVEREARLQRERSEEARRMAEEQRARLRAAEEEEARRKAEEQRARLRAAEEEEKAERVRQEEEQRAQRARQEVAEQRARLRAAQEAERAERARQEEEEQAERARQEAEELARREKSARLAEQRRAREARKAEQERLAQEEAAKEAARRAEQERRAEEEAARQQAEQERRARRAAEADRLAQEEAARRNSQANRRALEEAVKNSLEQQRRQALQAAEAAAKAKAEEAARARALEAAKRHQSMPPPSAPQVPPGGRGASLPPVTTPVVAKPPRVPESVRSFVEESDLYGDAQIATPRPPAPGKKPVHRVVPKPVTRPEPESRSSSDPLTSEEIEAPVRKPPPRSPRQPEKALEKARPGHDDNTDELAREEIQEHNRSKIKTPKPHVHVADRLKSSLNPWSLWKLFLTSLLILYAYRFIYSMARPDLFESPITSLRWYGWNNWKANAGQFFPSPLLHPLGVLTDKQYDDLKEYIHNESSSTEEAVKSLQSILPRIVHVKKDRRTNKLIIDDEFWRALRDQVHSDDTILTLDGKSDISDKQWKAIQNRLKKSGDVEDTAERTLTKSWEKWLRSNERKVADIIGKHLPHGKPGKHGGGDIQDIAITKEEFTRRLQPILDENKLTSAKIRELEKLVNKSLEKSRSTGDISTINESKVKEIVIKAIKSAKLEAAASSEISRFDAELQKQLNHFGIGNGAMVDETFSSPTWEVVKPPLGSREWLKTLPSTPRFLVERSAALSAWDEAGHCWCAGTQINATHSRPADLFVHLSNFVIPQHVVLEHINPAATLDPGAMPKDIEIWAQFDEYHRQEKIRDFMEVTFPDAYRAKRNRDLVGRGFLQIGRFRYEHRAGDRGVKVERLSRELIGLKAATDHVLVRAASNHGAGDHTCFYRIRLYGEVVALEAGERESRGW
ncbi:hypothetical protein V8F33_012953 [Rhypophila sp. PSN 637]